jgi:hypothetical protein
MWSERSVDIFETNAGKSEIENLNGVTAFGTNSCFKFCAINL